MFQEYMALSESFLNASIEKGSADTLPVVSVMFTFGGGGTFACLHPYHCMHSKTMAAAPTGIESLTVVAFVSLFWGVEDIATIEVTRFHALPLQPGSYQITGANRQE